MAGARGNRRGMGGMFSTIRPTSPEPSTYSGMAEDQDEWLCEDWYQYLYRNIMAFGKKQGTSIYNKDAERIGFWSEWHDCRYGCDWINRMLEIAPDANTGANFFSKSYCAFEQVPETVDETIEQTGESAGKLLRWAPVIIIGGVLAYAEYKTKFIRKAFAKN